MNTPSPFLSIPGFARLFRVGALLLVMIAVLARAQCPPVETWVPPTTETVPDAWVEVPESTIWVEEQTITIPAHEIWVEEQTIVIPATEIWIDEQTITIPGGVVWNEELQDYEWIPEHTETIPAHPETIPERTEIILAHPETVPERMETIPAHEEIVPEHTVFVPAYTIEVPGYWTLETPVTWTAFSETTSSFISGTWLPDAGTIAAGSEFTQTITYSMVTVSGERSCLGEERNVTITVQSDLQATQTAIGTMADVWTAFDETISVDGTGDWTPSTDTVVAPNPVNQTRTATRTYRTGERHPDGRERNVVTQTESGFIDRRTVPGTGVDTTTPPTTTSGYTFYAHFVGSAKVLQNTGSITVRVAGSDISGEGRTFPLHTWVHHADGTRLFGTTGNVQCSLAMEYTWSQFAQTGTYTVRVDTDATDTVPVTTLSFEVVDSTHSAITKRDTFYIAPPPLGSDGNTGRDPGQPWSTFGRINELVREGDTVLLKRGGTWNLTSDINLQIRGDEDNWITIGAYDVGPKPVIIRTQTPGGSGDTSCISAVDSSGYVIIRDLEFRNAQHGVYWVGGRGLDVVDCDFVDTSYGIYVGHVRDSGYRFCNFTRCFVGLAAGHTTNLSTSVCGAGSPGSGGISLASCNQAYVRGWTIINTGKSGAHPGAAGIYIDGGQGIHVTGCHIDGVQHFGNQSDGAAIAIETGDHNPRPVRDVTVFDCDLLNTDGPAVCFLGENAALNVLIKGLLCVQNNRLSSTWVSHLGLTPEQADTTFTCFIPQYSHLQNIRFVDNVRMSNHPNNRGRYAQVYNTPPQVPHGFLANKHVSGPED